MSRIIDGRTATAIARLNQRINATSRANCPGPDALPDVLGLAFRPGARVIDQVTGQKGVILAGRKTNTVVHSPGR